MQRRISTGLCLYADRKAAEAERDFTRAIALDPTLYDAYSNRGVVRDINHEYAKAVSDFNESLRIQPSFAIAYNDRDWSNGSKPILSAPSMISPAQSAKIPDIRMRM